MSFHWLYLSLTSLYNNLNPLFVPTIGGLRHPSSAVLHPHRCLSRVLQRGLAAVAAKCAQKVAARDTAHLPGLGRLDAAVHLGGHPIRPTTRREGAHRAQRPRTRAHPCQLRTGARPQARSNQLHRVLGVNAKKFKGKSHWLESIGQGWERKTHF